MIRALLVGVIIGALLVPKLSDAHYTPAKPKPYGQMTTRETHAHLVKLRPHLDYVVREGSGYPRWWHRKALRRLNRRIARLEDLLTPPIVDAAWAWFRSPTAQCVANHEGGFNSADLATGNTYFGRMQGDRSFLATYGPEFYRRYGRPHGVPGRWLNPWPASAQVVTFYRGYRARGWGPWPTYYAYCA